MRSGNGKRDAADVLSGYRFELMLEVARELFDLVVISGANLGEAASHVLAQRVDDVLLVASAGHTVTHSLEAADRDFAIRRATLLGVVLIRRRRTKLIRWAAGGFRGWLWRTIDRFSQGKGDAADDAAEAAVVPIDDADDAEGQGSKGGAHVRDEKTDD
jgi:Mrp family chromosome partitioning ATPase